MEGTPPVGIIIQEPNANTGSGTHVKFGEEVVEVSKSCSEEEGTLIKSHKRASSLDTQNLQVQKSNSEHSPRSSSPKVVPFFIRITFLQINFYLYFQGDPIEKSYTQSHRIDLSLTKGKMVSFFLSLLFLLLLLNIYSHLI